MRSGPFEGPAIVKPPALPGDTYFGTKKSLFLFPVKVSSFKKIFRINKFKHSIPVGIEIASLISHTEGKQVKSKKGINIRLASECKGGGMKGEEILNFAACLVTIIVALFALSM